MCSIHKCSTFELRKKNACTSRSVNGSADASSNLCLVHFRTNFQKYGNAATPNAPEIKFCMEESERKMRASKMNNCNLKRTNHHCLFCILIVHGSVHVHRTAYTTRCSTRIEKRKKTKNPETN